MIKLVNSRSSLLYESQRAVEIEKNREIQIQYIRHELNQAREVA
jgi:hypothetical protein